MLDDYERRARFAHRFFTPFTSLQAGLSLLERQLKTNGDPQALELLELLSRATQRLRVAINMLDASIVEGVEPLTLVIADALLAEPSHVAPPASQPGMPPAPLSPAELAPIPAEVKPAVPSKATVLLIEDSLTYRAVMSARLQAAGYTVETAIDGTIGLDLARQLQPDVIILDLMLPALTGERVAFVLGEDPETKHMPIVIYTALDPENRGSLDPRLRVVHKDEALDHLPALLDELIAERQRPQCPQILVVEDDPGLQELIIRGLSREGYGLTGAASGEEGLRLAQRQPFDLILLDVMLPDLDGLDVLRQLRAWNQTATTPTMLISVLNSPEEKARGLQLGADDYLSKPFDWQELAARVQASLRRRELEGSANPSTMLPGNKAIERAITARIELGLPFAVGYSDLDNFKAYNDRYGFLKGDAMIHQTARIIMAAVEEHGDAGDFVGHIGGDDFVFVAHPQRIDAICAAIITEFDQLAPLYYDLEARQRGSIEQRDRQGRLTSFPLVSISIGVVSSLNHPISHFAQVGDIAADLKKRAKAQPGSVFIIAGAGAAPAEG